MKTTQIRKRWRDRFSRWLITGYFIGMPLAVINPVLFDPPDAAPSPAVLPGPSFVALDLALTRCTDVGPRMPGTGCSHTEPALDAPLWLHRTVDQGMA